MEALKEGLTVEFDELVPKYLVHFVNVASVSPVAVVHCREGESPVLRLSYLCLQTSEVYIMWLESREWT